MFFRFLKRPICRSVCDFNLGTHSWKRPLVSTSARAQLRRTSWRSVDTSGGISNFDRTHLKRSDFVDISRELRFRAPIHIGKNEIVHVQLLYYRHKGVQSVFPLRTEGFFYFHRPEGLSCVASGIRFRRTISLATISRTHTALRRALLSQRLVSEDDIQSCLELFPGKRAHLAHSLLHRLDQPFPVEFDRAHYIRVVAAGATVRCDVRAFHEQRKGATTALFPYSGRALVRFELSTLQEHQGSRVVLLRVVKIIQPPKLRIPKYDGHLPAPVEGELVLRPRGHKKSGVQPWSRCLDSPNWAALGLLLDTDTE
ncbi:hypothetical protein C8J57DRAFT_1268935 [Mycena rebaudengoi]|nr:hypothetical protein C8J57DRAFT_1268935 [Mycena rebaudengoi]